MERYEFKVKGPKEKWVKIFLSAEEVKTLGFKVSHVPHLNAISQLNLHGKELSLKYADTLNDWIELSADDLDSFVDMIETDVRGNLITIELKVCELAQTLQQTEQKRLPSSPSPNYERVSGSVHVAKNQPARRLDEEFTCSLF